MELAPAARRLVLAVFLTAVAGILYELLLGTLSTLLLGDSTLEWSLTIGIFLSAMGLGSWLSRYVDGALLPRLLAVELALALFGGFAPLALFSVYAADERALRGALVATLLLLGAGIGLEIPLLTRLLKQHGSLKDALAAALALDYIGALFASLAFPLALYPLLGLARTALVGGLLNLAVVALLFSSLQTWRRAMLVALLSCALALGLGLGLSSRAMGWLDRRLFGGEVLHAETSRFQEIARVKRPGTNELRLYANRNLQFSSVDEARYHEALVHPAMGATAARRRVLVLGGGDGLAARELLAYPEVERILLVDLDPRMTELARALPAAKAQNRGALDDPRVTLVHEDAWRFLQESQELFDVAIVDLPDPGTPGLARLFSREAYALLAARLSPGGIFVVQATSPYYTRRSFWCIERSIAAAGLATRPYHVWVPSFGAWGFVLGGRTLPREPPTIGGGPHEYLGPAQAAALWDFPADMGPVEVAPNTLLEPTLYRLYNEETRLAP